VAIVFNNAGYIVTGFFEQTPLDRQLANLECNSTACVKVTHHFLSLMTAKGLRGCFVFTSSVSGYIPNPFAVMYGATKAFVSQFAASLAIEVRESGIDVLAVHPSPVSSRFFDKAHKLDSLQMAQRAAVAPSSVPDKMLACVGRAHLGDLGGMALGVRALVAAVPYDFLTGTFAFFAPYMPDYQAHCRKKVAVGKKE
jgi:short-subunit dehydrogenase